MGLMTLDVEELKLIKESGNMKDRKYAERILPIREKGNFLLCTLLIGNTLVNVLVSLLNKVFRSLLLLCARKLFAPGPAGPIPLGPPPVAAASLSRCHNNP